MKRVVKSLTLFLVLCVYINIFGQPATSTPGISVGLLYSGCNVADGYTLYSAQNSNNTYLIDNCGYIINQWAFSGGTNYTGTYLTETGNVIKIVANGTGVATYGSGCIEKRDWNDNLLWEYCGTGTNIGIHSDLYELPNGNIIALVQRQYSATQATQKGVNPANFGNFYKTEAVIEVQQTGPTTGNIVWEWDLWDHIVQNNNPNISSTYVSDFSTVPGKFDGDLISGSSHFNSINYMEDRDHILMSNWLNDEIYIIDHDITTAQAAGAAGDFLWRWGNPSNYNAGTYADKRLNGQHNPKLIPANYAVHGGKISVFNNEYTSLNVATSGGSAACVIDASYDAISNTYAMNAMSGAFLPANYSYSWAGDIFAGDNMYSDIMSGVDAQANGNLMITEATSGRISEVTPSGEVVWVYQTPDNGNNVQSQGSTPFGRIYKIDKYAANYPGILSTTSTGQLVENVNSVSVACNVGIPPNLDGAVGDFQSNLNQISNSISCLSSNSDLVANFILANEGGVDITSMTYEYVVNGNVIITSSYSGNLASCGREPIGLPNVQLAPLANTTIAVNILTINGLSTDNVPGNNTYSVSTNLNSTPGLFVDSGGSTQSYSDTELEIYTICPTNSFLETIELTFNFVDIEVSSNGGGVIGGCWDYLTIYNGNSILAPILAQSLCGEESGSGQQPSDNNSLLSVGDVFTSTDVSGCLTVVFKSDGSVTNAGWEATSACVSNGNTVCQSVENINGPITAGLYSADDILISDAQINLSSGGPVEFNAGDDYIELISNFVATGEFDFDAKIIDCDLTN